MTKQEWEAKEKTKQNVVNALDKILDRFKGQIIGSKKITDHIVYTRISDTFFIVVSYEWIIDRDLTNSKPEFKEDLKGIISKYLSNVHVIIDMQNAEEAGTTHIQWLQSMLSADKTYIIPSKYKSLQEGIGDHMLTKGKAVANYLDTMIKKDLINDYVVAAKEEFRLLIIVNFAEAKHSDYSFDNYLFNQIESVITRYMNLPEDEWIIHVIMDDHEGIVKRKERYSSNNYEVYTPNSQDVIKEQFEQISDKELEQMKGKLKVIRKYVDKDPSVLESLVYAYYHTGLELYIYRVNMLCTIRNLTLGDQLKKIMTRYLGISTTACSITMSTVEKREFYDYNAQVAKDKIRSGEWLSFDKIDDND